MNKAFFEALAAILSVLLAREVSSEELSTKFAGKATGCLRDAIRWADRAKGTYLSYDYELFLAPQQAEAKRDVLEAVEKPRDWKYVSYSNEPKDPMDVVLLPLGLGMRAHKGVSDPNGLVKRSGKVMTKARALIGQCVFQ